MSVTHARVVIIGGGVMGCGLAYHLAHEGWTDIVLLEKSELTSGSTWHAAGQITHSTSSFSLGKCVGYNIDLYSQVLEKETGQSVTWHGCGSFRLAYTEDEFDWLRQTMSVGRALGFEMELVGPERVRELHPFYNLEGVRAALYTPDDGHVDPAGATFALAKGARQLGATITRHCRVVDVKPEPNGEWRVYTEQGEIVCEHVVNAGGTYARQVGKWVGLDVPTTSMTHHYLITDTVPEFMDLERELPVVRDDRLVSGYIRMEQKSGLIGIYEKANPNTVWVDECPWEAEHELFEPDYDRIMPWLENAMGRMPVLAELGIKQAIHGAISHPPDGNPLIGPAPGLRNFWLNCGCQIGIGWGPGLTRELARWMVHGAADINMRDYDPRRYGKFADQDYQVTKAKEDYLLRHEIPFPHLNRTAGRPVKPSALYDRLKDKGAVFEEVYGWERPRWFARGGLEQRDYYSFRRPAWHDLVGEEVRAVRERAGLVDISAFTKVEVSGPDAAGFLDRLVPNRLPSKPGRIALTHLLNDTGRIELETTIVRFAEDRFYFTCAAFFEQRLLDHLAFSRRPDEAVTITNLSEEWGAVALNGPRARDILCACTDAALDNAAFAWLTAQPIAVAGQKVWAFRMSYAGELGWELHGPRDSLPVIYDALHEAGAAFGLADYGSFAMNVMRLEKMFKGAGELTNEVTLPEADVMRFVKMDKPDFRGKRATEAALAEPPRWLCAYLEIEADGICDGNGGEAVVLDGRVVGSVTSIAYGGSVGAILAFAYIAPQAAVPGTELDVIIMGEARKARVRDEPAYDPQNRLPRTDAEPLDLNGKAIANA
ncbi:FAD-dependent oxidoreductase [Nitratireductor sp. StC3]|uniref:FAD-dependent oxidoreductase n=1 Tax=Nitratireductor sp. StC3 TaxID=2126741 RepID=UPI000D0D816C|nr:FAD-dependent oxidoreductase [Nitratireductor sp. StC3]PSM16356.1 glycine cleavage system protein T [Nitratireductor sp. StC3]